MKKIGALAAAIIVLVIAVFGFWYFKYGKSRPVDTESAVETTEVSIENGKFAPETIKIKAGDTVTWTNNDSVNHFVASDPHPIHTDLPGLKSEVLEPGETYSFTFEEAGEHTYHCHIHPSMKGAVVVE